MNPSPETTKLHTNEIRGSKLELRPMKLDVLKSCMLPEILFKDIKKTKKRNIHVISCCLPLDKRPVKHPHY